MNIMPASPATAERTTARRVVRTGLVLSILYWNVLLVVLTALALLDGWETVQTFIGRCVNTVLAIALTVLIAWIVTAMTRGSFTLRAVMVLVLTLIAACIYFYVSFHLFRALGANEDPLTLASALRMILYWFGVFLGSSALLLALLYHVEVQDRERQLSQLREQAYGAQMRALRYQINPHFLFNTLNAVAGLIEERAHGPAERMVLSLSGFLRSTLALDPLQDVTLAEELDIQARYLEIERERFSDRLTVTVAVPVELADTLVPSLILQPLVENAVKHGVSAVERAVAVHIRAEQVGDQVRVTVENDAPDTSPASAGTGVGLDNVAQRLAARFGSEGRLESGRHEAGLFRAAISFPLRRKQP